MRQANVWIAILGVFSLPLGAARPSDGRIVGKVMLKGIPPKPLGIDMSKQPECVKLDSKPAMTEQVVTGPDNSLENVVVYISAGAPEDAPPPTSAAAFDQRNCHYTTHVLAFRVGQEVSISNSDPFNHNIHPLPIINREWNRMQLPGTPPFTYAYEHQEFIPVKCNVHSWMRAYFAVLRTSHFAVTGSDGKFDLPDLPSGKYTITAWHEFYGMQSKEITLVAGQPGSVDFVFTAKP
jgi:hypothetical protein